MEMEITEVGRHHAPGLIVTAVQGGPERSLGLLEPPLLGQGVAQVDGRNRAGRRMPALSPASAHGSPARARGSWTAQPASPNSCGRYWQS